MFVISLTILIMIGFIVHLHTTVERNDSHYLHEVRKTILWISYPYLVFNIIILITNLWTGRWHGFWV